MVRHRAVITRVAVLAALLGAACPAAALDPGRAVTQYVPQVWRTDEGLPQNTVQAICQTRDGYLWIGTQEGLARFDGIRFTIFDRKSTPERPSAVPGRQISSEYGPRWGHVHKGIDIAADTGEPVLAAADGEGIYSGCGLSGYGNVVILRHDAHLTTLYAHNSALKVERGDNVKAGQTIALLGSTGHSTGPHCHFEIRDDSAAVNPRLRLAKNRIFEQQTLMADASRAHR